MIEIIEATINVSLGQTVKLVTLYGNSQEDKPTGDDIAPGSVCIETDTHKKYMYDATDGWGEM